MTSTEVSRDPSDSDERTASTSASNSPARSTKRNGNQTLTIALVLGCIGVALYAAFGSSSPSKEQSTQLGAAMAADTVQSSPHALEPGSAPSDAPGAGALGGTVQEVIQVSNYTYLRVQPPSGGEFWAAVTKTNVGQGAQVTFEGAELMTGFSSKELGRTFEQIYFARLSTGAGLDAKRGGEFPAPTKEEGLAAKKAAAMVAEEVPVRSSVKAEGPGGRLVGEIYGQAAALAGQTVRVRATVVKVTRKVMGTNFLHVRDGSGDSAKGSHDITLKISEEPPRLGAEALFEGTVAVDVDLGAGYNYPVLIEDARVVVP